MKNCFYTYAYFSESGVPYYIGKGKGKRAWNKHGKIPVPENISRIVILKKNLTEGEAFKHEIYMIAVFGRKDKGTGVLLNKTDGGEGGSGSARPDLSEYNSTVKKGSTLTKEHVNKVREAMIKRGSLPHMSETGRKSIAKFHQRRKEDSEFNFRYEEMLKENGRKMGPINGKKNKGRKHSEEFKAKCSKPGELNPMFGKIRITNGKENAQISPDEPIPEGWRKGMTCHKSRDKSKTQKSVELTCISTGKVTVFASIVDAAKEFSLSPALISEVCNGKRKVTKGYTARYL